MSRRRKRTELNDDTAKNVMGAQNRRFMSGRWFDVRNACLGGQSSNDEVIDLTSRNQVFIEKAVLENITTEEKLPSLLPCKAYRHFSNKDEFYEVDFTIQVENLHIVTESYIKKNYTFLKKYFSLWQEIDFWWYID